MNPVRVGIVKMPDDHYFISCEADGANRHSGKPDVLRLNGLLEAKEGA